MPPTCAQGRAAKAAMENFSSSLCHGLPVLFFACGGKESACNPGETGDIGSIPGWGRSPGGGLGNPLQYSCLERIPWTEQPGGLQPMGSQRVRHD